MLSNIVGTVEKGRLINQELKSVENGRKYTENLESEQSRSFKVVTYESFLNNQL